MKKIALILFSSLLLTHAVFAQMADQKRIVATCTDARTELGDAGYSINIVAGGLAGKTVAHIKALSVRGPVALGSYDVKKSRVGTQLIYSGKNFKLSISLESVIINRGSKPSRLTATA